MNRQRPSVPRQAGIQPVLNTVTTTTTTNLDEAAVLASTQILAAQHVSVAESIQLLLMYITNNQGKDTLQTTVSYVEDVLRLVCRETEPEMAVL